MNQERRRKAAIRTAVEQAVLQLPIEKRRVAKWVLESACLDRPVNLKKQSEILEIRFSDLYKLIGKALAIFNETMWDELD